MVKQSDYDTRVAWLRNARFGMFVHWGMYSTLGRGEQIVCRDLIPQSEYEAYAADFTPPRDWAGKLVQTAVDAGAKYIVLTTRHHDGYCLFNTATHNFNAVHTGPRRDLIAEYVAAARSAGLKIGFYYSLLNWRWPGFWSPEKYPGDLPRMVAEVHKQVEELMSNYGNVNVLWYDAPVVPGSAGHGMWGGHPIDEEPGDFWQAAELNAMVRRLQPDILINNRSGLPEDFGTPEQRILGSGGSRAWETCMTLNYAPGWGYLRHSMANKTAGEVLFNLIDAVRLGGNFLFNVGPRADGSVDEREASVLKQIGAWLQMHGEAVYGTQPEAVYDLAKEHVQGPMFQYGMWTCRQNIAYLTLFYYPGSSVTVSKIGPRIRSATLLTTGQKLELTDASNGRIIISGLPDDPPDPLAPVLRVEFEGPPYAVTEIGAEWLDGTMIIPDS